MSARHRRRSIARQLIATLLEEGRALGCTEAWVATELDNAPARALYRSSGAIEDGEPAVVCVFSLTQTYPPTSPSQPFTDGERGAVVLRSEVRVMKIET